MRLELQPDFDVCWGKYPRSGIAQCTETGKSGDRLAPYPQRVEEQIQPYRAATLSSREELRSATKEQLRDQHFLVGLDK